MKFAEKVKKARIQLGFSQTELAEKLGVSFSTVNRWENGKTVPNNLTKKVVEDFCKSKGVNW